MHGALYSLGQKHAGWRGWNVGDGDCSDGGPQPHKSVLRLSSRWQRRSCRAQPTGMCYYAYTYSKIFDGTVTRTTTLSLQDGTTVHSMTDTLPGSGSIISIAPRGKKLYFFRSGGDILLLNTDRKTALPAVTASYHLDFCDGPRYEDDTKPSNAVSGPATPFSTSVAPQSPSTVTEREAKEDVFIPSQGYRGQRPGYMFRSEGGPYGVGYYKNEVLLRGKAEHQTQQQRQEPTVGVRCCVLSPDATWAAIALSHPDDGRVFIYNLSEHTTGKTKVQKARFLVENGHRAGVLAMAWSPDGALLFTGSYDKTIRVWETKRWTCCKVLKGHGGGIRGLCTSADGRTLFSAAADNTIRAWTIGGPWICLRLLNGRHDDMTWPQCMDISPKNGMMVTGSTGFFGASTLKVFDAVGSGSCLATFAQLGYDQRGNITSVSCGETCVYSGASDGTVAGWALSTQEQKTRGAGFSKGFFISSSS